MKMNKKKLIFSSLTIIILLICSVGVYNCYDVIVTKNNKKINFSSDQILYEVFDNIYALSFQLDNVDKKEGIPKYLTANEKASNEFYNDSILYNREMMSEKRNIKYFAEGNNNSLGNTNDDLKNISSNEKLKKKYQWYLKLQFDENGQISFDPLGCANASNNNYELVWNNFKQTNFKYLDAYDEGAVLHNPTNTTIYFAIPYKISAHSVDSISEYHDANTTIIEYENIFPFVLIALAVVSIYILLYRYDTVKEIGTFKYLAKIKLELLLIALVYAFAGIITIICALAEVTLDGSFLTELNSIGLGSASEPVLGLINIFVWCLFFYLAMFVIYYIKSFFKEGLIASLRNNTLIVLIIKKIKTFIKYIFKFNFNDQSNKIILKIILFNCLVISIICCFFVYGIIFALIYSAILFVILKNKIAEIKDDYQVLLEALKRLSNGNFDIEINQDLGVFNTLKNEITNIKDGFEKAVNEEVKSQKMKTELISNVSHDLKTPLTSIITYVDLLKDENLDRNKRKEYINTLDRNSLRLKNLINDLFEVSKVNSGNVKLNIVDVDIVALIQQAKFELTDEFGKKELIFKENFPDEKVILALDSFKTYRIFENLLANISKYALENTRIYIDIINLEDHVKIIFKNISANEIKISEDELVERFVQGDASRNTSGSGLGLAIAKSFTELQKGEFKISVDGDLFKAIVIFKK